MSRPYRSKKRRGRRPSNWANWDIQHSPGKFEGEGNLTQYLYDLSLHGDGETYSDGNGGASATVIDGPFDTTSLRETEGFKLNRSEKRYAKNSCGAILHEDSNGFVTSYWFVNTEEGRAKFWGMCRSIENDYTVDDEDDLLPLD